MNTCNHVKTKAHVKSLKNVFTNATMCLRSLRLIWRPGFKKSMYRSVLRQDHAKRTVQNIMRVNHGVIQLGDYLGIRGAIRLEQLKPRWTSIYTSVVPSLKLVLKSHQNLPI